MPITDSRQLGIVSLIAAVRALFARGPWPSIDPGLAQALDRHGLGAHVYAEGHRRGLPVAVLRRSWMTSAARRHERAGREVLFALRDLDCIAWKGLDYAHRLYPDPAERPMGDHDLLVRERDFRIARERLAALGYTDALVQRGVAAHPAHYAAQLVRDDHHVDLHRSVRQAVRASIDYDAIFRRAERGILFGESVRFLAPHDRLMLHVAHLAAHELLVPLVAYVDLERLIAETPVSPALFAEAKAFGLRRPFEAVLAARADLFGWPSRRGLRPSLRAIAAGRRPSRPVQLLRKAALFDSPRALLRFGLYALGAGS